MSYNLGLLGNRARRSGLSLYLSGTDKSRIRLLPAPDRPVDCVQWTPYTNTIMRDAFLFRWPHDSLLLTAVALCASKLTVSSPVTDSPCR